MDFPRHNRTPVKNACNNALKLTHDLRCDKKVFAAANENAIFDIALPASAIIEVLQKLPIGAAVLLQKPMGSSLAAAKEIVALVESKKFIAADPRIVQRDATYVAPKPYFNKPI